MRWMDHSGMELKKPAKRCACFSLSELRMWLGGAVILCVCMILLLRFNLLDGPLVQSYLGMVENRSYSMSYSHKPPKNGEKVREPSFISSALLLVNSSRAESSILSLWKNLMPAFARSDCFPEAKQALQEAENSWRELMQQRGLEMGNHSMNRTLEKKCPYSVGSINQSQFKRIPENVLEVPCGLIVDSSITIVGMPWGAEGNFAVEILGPKLRGNSEPPIVLHFNVRLQGDKITDNAVVVQNTWTRDHDWGDEERCPTSSSTVKKVDGFDTCSDQVGKAATRMFPEVKNPMIVKGLPSLASGDKTPWFPFMNGLPFAATLWVGWEGFHVTVNGKHVTSFEYRQNLKPSLANAVRLKGSVKPISIIATGLPTTEDATQVDVEFLKAPPTVPKQRCELFIGIFSTANNFDRRMAVRRSWMQYEAVRSGLVIVRFFVGQTEFVQPEYIMKTDDDTFVRVDEVLLGLNKTEKKEGLLFGSIEFTSYPHRDPNDKWFVSTEEWPYPSYPPWAHGPGYIISLDIAKYVVQAHHDMILKLFKLEDVSMGIWIEEYKQQGHSVQYKDDQRFDNVGCSDGYVIAHYQKQKHMACLWEKLKAGLGPVCCN